MEPAVDIASTIGTVLILIFMTVIGGGALQIVSESNRRWEERYGNRWFMSKATKERLDKAYAERKAAQKAS